jgi:hypothetical protein
MVWKQDLAKLKQQFKEVGEPKSKPPAPKPVPKPEAAGSIEEEDALFLSAMGRPQASPPAPRREGLTPSEPGPEIPQPVAEPLAQPLETFEAAMGGLKGLKPLGTKIPAKVEKPRPAANAIPAPPVEQPTVLPPPEATEAPAPAREEEPSRVGPVLIHLAAGMAIEVDGSLDLRGHTTIDAMERFRERVQDGVFLGWRTLHVTLGVSDELKTAFLEFLRNGEARSISRYAQAPIPMGGNQAWILYYLSPGAH